MANDTIPTLLYGDRKLAAGLSVGGCLIISIATCLQKAAHLKSDVGHLAFLRSHLWWSGTVLLFVGETASFCAYAFSTVAFLTPIPAISIVVSTMLLLFFKMDYLHWTHALGMAAAVSGVCLVVVFAPSFDHQLITGEYIVSRFLSWDVIVYLILEVQALCILLYIYHKKIYQHYAVILLLVAILGSVTAFCTRGVMALILLSAMGDMQLTHSMFYILLICLFASVFFQADFLQQAAEMFGPCRLVAGSYISITVSSVLAGEVFYHEFNSSSILHILLFILGCLLCFSGVLLVTWERRKAQELLPFTTSGAIQGVCPPLDVLQMAEVQQVT
uniref:NIPA-like protein 3 n=1 Tax=Myxine glutinosa TaxID=7769 RepID=UPI00358EFB1D